MNTNKRIHKPVVNQAKSPSIPSKKQPLNGNFNIINHNIYSQSLLRESKPVSSLIIFLKLLYVKLTSNHHDAYYSKRKNRSYKKCLV